MTELIPTMDRIRDLSYTTGWNHCIVAVAKRLRACYMGDTVSLAMVLEILDMEPDETP